MDDMMESPFQGALAGYLSIWPVATDVPTFGLQRDFGNDTCGSSMILTLPLQFSKQCSA
jgi:hypothetical protein